MNAAISIWCALLPCSSQQRWAVPQRCMGEMLSLPGEGKNPPPYVTWREQNVPVLDMAPDDDSAWRDEHTGNGLVAIILGLPGDGPDYWGVALRGGRVGIVDIGQADINDAPEQVTDNATAAFFLDDVLYQVPDLPEWQQRMAATAPAEAAQTRTDKESPHADESE